MKQHRVRGVIFPVLAAFIWGMAFVAQSKGASKSIGPFTFNATRSFIGALALVVIYAVFALIRKKNGTYFGNSVSSLKKLVLGGLCCGTCLFVATNLQQSGIGTSSVGKSSFITALYIVLVPIFGVFLKKRVNTGVIVSIAVAVVGLYLLCIKPGEKFSINVGDLYLLACAATFAFHILCVDYFSDGTDGILLSLVQFEVCAIESAIFMVIFENPSLSVLLECKTELLYVGIMSSGVGYTLQIISQQDSDPTVVSLLFSLESVFGALGGAVILHEVLLPREYVGSALVLAAVVLAQLPEGTVKKLINKLKT